MRKKSLKALLLSVLTLTFLFTSSFTAYAASSSVTKVTVYGYTYNFWAEAYHDSDGSWAYTIAETANGNDAPAGYMGVIARLYNSSDILVASSGNDYYYYNSPSSNIVESTPIISGSGNYYSQGKVQFYNGSTYTPYTTTKSPYVAGRVASSTIKPYQTNINGESYGYAGQNADMIGYEPDLIAAYGTDGTFGYVRATELVSPTPSSPEEAIALSQQNKNGKTINVYGKDGITVISTFKLASGRVK